jgi:chorismate dehydratase
MRENLNKMHTPRISASSYSNTAPLIWSFLYGSNHGSVELILDNAPARSAELFAQDRVDAALVPVIASQSIEGVRLIPDVCVGARERVRSVCLVTRGAELANVRSVALDTSSRTSVVLTKIIFREFLGFEPQWLASPPDIGAMLAAADAALIIGDPALSLSNSLAYRVFDLAELWHTHTGLGFIFAMWMTRRDRVEIDFASARDEGLDHLSEIAANYDSQIGLSPEQLAEYLSVNISFSPDASMLAGMDLYFDLAFKHRLTERMPQVRYL